MDKLKVRNKRVDFYRVTLNEGFDSFAIGPDLLFQDALRFIWHNKYGLEMEKIVPVSYFAKYLGKVKKLIWFDDKLNDKVYRGEFYPLPAEVIYKYRDQIFH